MGGGPSQDRGSCRPVPGKARLGDCIYMAVSSGMLLCFHWASLAPQIKIKIQPPPPSSQPSSHPVQFCALHVIPK